MLRLLQATVVVLWSSFSLAQMDSGSPFDCEIIDNDLHALYCQQQGGTEETLWHVGSRREFHSFETVSRSLTSELEEDYSMILIANTSTNTNWGPGEFMPGQTMVVLEKPAGQSLFFERDRQGVITGLKRGVKQLTQIIGTGHRSKIRDASSKAYGMPYTKNGMELIPVSSGSGNHMLSFSGIFQVNWGRSNPRKRRGWGNPMSNPLYFGYYYTYSNGNRERVSYSAFHGTPRANWRYLGVRRDSHGCIRVHPAVMEGIRARVESMSAERVMELNWDYTLPRQDTRTPYADRKPILLITFNSYDTVGA